MGNSVERDKINNDDGQFLGRQSNSGPHKHESKLLILWQTS